MRLETLISIAKKPQKAIAPLGAMGFFNWLPDRPYLKLLYWAQTGRKLNVETPRTFNEKLQWLKIYNRKPQYKLLVDKYSVRKFISETLGKNYLVPLIAIFENVEEIDWDALPNKFALKCNHGSGGNIICHDKGKLNIEESKIKLKNLFGKNGYWYGREWVYKNIEKKILVELLLEDKEHGIPHDYKFWVFNEKVEFINVHFHDTGKTKINIYNRNWDLQNFGMVYENDLNICHSKPDNLGKMITDAEKIAKVLSLPFVRIDFYEIDKKVFFGEITFFPTSGFIRFFPQHDELDKTYGDLLNLNISKT